jgi:hypothetical protein
MVNAFGMALLLAVHDGIQRLQFSVAGEYRFNKGIGPVRQADPDLETND